MLTKVNIYNELCFYRPLNPKEDIKNLLEPEVGLASSVLETIREATEVEYKDALAREAAKTRAADDVAAEESAPNIVTIILPSHKKGNDNDLLSEATDIHDSRCTHSVGSSLGRMNKLKIIPKNLWEIISRIPNAKREGFLHKYPLDMDNYVQASNVQESFSQKNQPSVEQNTKSELVGPREGNSCIADSSKNSNAGPSALLHEETNRNNKDNVNLQTQPSNFKSLSLLPNKDIFKVKNVLKLKDTEIFSPIKKIDIPLLKLPSIFHRELPHLTNILRDKNYLKHANEWNSIKNCDKASTDLEMKTNILEKEPSSSFNEMKEESVSPENVDLHQISRSTPQNQIVKTDIVDAISSPSENIIILNLNDNNENKLSLPTNIFKESEDGCINIEQENKVIDNTSEEELNHSSSDLMSDTTDDDNNISITNDKDESSNVLTTKDDVNDNLIDDDCITYTDSDQEKTGDMQVFENNDNSESDIKSIDNNDSGDIKDTDLPDNVSLNIVTTLVNHSISSPLGKTLTSIKEDIQNKIQELRKTPTLITQKTLKAIPVNNKQKGLNSHVVGSSTIQEIESPDIDLQNAASTVQLQLSKQNKGAKKILDNISMEDLQKMSDSLLKMSDLKQKVIEPENLELNRFENADLICNENSSSEAISDELFHSRSSLGIKNLRNLTEVNSDESLIGKKNSDDNQTNPKNSDEAQLDCLIEASSSRNFDKYDDKPLNKGVDLNEMAAEASESHINGLHQGPINLFNKLKSPLLQDIIVQPSSLMRDDLNPLSDGSKLNFNGLLNIPTLDEIRERLADFLGTNERETERETIDCEKHIMSSEPSEHIFHSIPLLKPLEDVDIDIFQLKPLNIGNTKLSEMPTLNLKSYKAKLPIPKNLQLKPMKLESTLGNSGGLLGATFKIGPESDIKNMLRNSLGRSSTIEDVTSQLKKNVETLLNNPLQDLRPSPINVFDLPNAFTEDLRSQTLNSIKGIQDNIGNSLKISQNDDSRSSLLKQPDAFFERIADVTDDFNDKLKGLHHDLNDRLLSIHENILDKTKLTSATSPLFDDRKAKEIMLSPLQQIKLSKMPLKQLSIEKRKNNHSLKLFGRSESEKVPQLRPSKINGNDKMKFKSSKMPPKASVSVPKSVPVPYLKQASTKPPLSYFQRNPKFKHIFDGIKREDTENQPVSIPLRFKNLNNQLDTNKPTKSLKDTKFKVTIASTTVSPLSTLKSRKTINPAIKTKKDNSLKQSEITLKESEFNDKKNYDTVDSPSEIKTVPLQLSYPRKIDSTTNKDIFPKSDIKKSLELTTALPIKEWLKQRHASKTRTSNKFDKKEEITEAPPSLYKLKSGAVDKSSGKEVNPWPEIIEKSFLSKVRDAVKARVSSPDLAKASDVIEKSKISSDMERAATDTTDVVLNETLKENVSYKCRMVCTKET